MFQYLVCPIFETVMVQNFCFNNKKNVDNIKNDKIHIGKAEIRLRSKGKQVWQYNLEGSKNLNNYIIKTDVNWCILIKIRSIS